MATKFQKCVASKLRGKHFKGRVKQKAAFKKAVKACKGKSLYRGKRRGKAKAKKRIRHHTSSLTNYNKCISKCQRKVGHSRGDYPYFSEYPSFEG